MRANLATRQLANHGRMRVGVLPFLASHLPMDETLASTASQEIAAALAKFQRFDVVPLAPSMSIPGPAPASRKSDELGELDYVVEGAVSSEGKHPQVSIRLLDLGAYARTVWSERTVLAVDKLRKWSELVATRVIGGIDPIVLFFDGQLRRRRRDGANGPLLLAIPLMHSLERRKYEEAGHLIDQALALEPDNAVALAWAAFWQVLYFGQGWTQDLAVACAIAQKRARAALELGSDDAEILSICGHARSFLSRDYDAALHYFDRAQRLDPTLESAWLWSALTYCYCGKPGIALERLQRYRDLAPIAVHYSWTQNICSVAYTFAGDYENAVKSGRRVVKMSPTFVNGYKPLIASLGHLGRAEEAKPYVDKLLALEPNFTVERFGQVYPIKYDCDREHYMKGLRLAGVPER